MFHDLAVVGLIKEVADALRHYRAHVVHFQQFLQARVHQSVDVAEVLGQVLGRALAHMADAQTEQEAAQGGVPALRDRVHQVLRALLAHAVQRGELGKAQRVQVGQRAQDAGVHQLVDQLVAQAFDVHHAAAGKVQQRLLALGRAVQATGAAPVGLAFFAFYRAGTHRAVATQALVEIQRLGHIGGWRRF